MELVTWLIGSEVALTVAAVAALAFTSLAILRDVSQRRSCRLLLPIRLLARDDRPEREVFNHER
jgi:hypothetical protein